jgi:hydrogenase maturation factor
MGKLGNEDLVKILDCIKRTPKVIVPPLPGFDSGVHAINKDEYLVVSTDPCLGVPDKWFGWLLLNYAASDVALFGARPEFCTINLLGPTGTKPEVFHKIMKQTCKAADELHTAIVTGHTGTYRGLSTIVGVCTVYGLINREKLITPGNGKAGDSILCVKTVGLETVINFSLIRRALASKLFGVERTSKITKLVKAQSCVKEALLMAEMKGVHAMHDATEGGIVSALNEMARASGLGFRVKRTMIPVLEEAKKLQRHFNLSDSKLLSMSSTGTILAAVSDKEKDEIVAHLTENNIRSTIIGSLTEDLRCCLETNGKIYRFPAMADDPYQKITSTHAR